MDGLRVCLDRELDPWFNDCSSSYEDAAVIGMQIYLKDNQDENPGGEGMLVPIGNMDCDDNRRAEFFHLDGAAVG